MFDGRWYKTGTGSPTTRIVDEFFKLLSAKENANRTTTPVIVTVPKKSPIYARYIKVAARLLEYADYDVDLVIDALKRIFSDRRTAWKNHNLLYIEADFLVALAVERANREEAQKQAKQVNTVVKNLVKVDVFSRRKEVE